MPVVLHSITIFNTPKFNNNHRLSIIANTNNQNVLYFLNEAYYNIINKKNAYIRIWNK